MKLNRQIDRSPFDSSVLKSIPMASHWIGSREVAINRRPHAQEDLASHYDAASESWSRTARRFQLEASTAFWAQKPVEGFAKSQIEYSAPHKEGVP